jgi:hypothetical protein
MTTEMTVTTTMTTVPVGPVTSHLPLVEEVSACVLDGVAIASTQN